MKKILLSVCTATAILAATSFTNPLPNSVKATDNGGVLQAIDAYKDGIGAELMDKPGVASMAQGINTCESCALSRVGNRCALCTPLIHVAQQFC